MNTDDYKRLSIRENLQRFFRLLKPYRKQFSILLLLILFVEATSVVERYMFKIVVDRGTEYSAGTLARDSFANILLIIFIVFVVMLILRAIAKYMHMGLINRLDASLIADLKRKFFNHIIKLSHGFHTGHKTGSLISRLTRGARAVESMMDVIVFNVTPMMFQLIVACIALVALSWTSVVFIAGTVLVFVLYSIFMQQLQLPSKLEANDLEDAEKANIGDIFTNIDSIKYFGKEADIEKKYYTLSERSKRAMVKHWDYYRTLDAGHAIILGVGTILVIAVPLQNYLNGALTLGTLVFIYTVYAGLMGPMFRFVQGIRSFYQATADFESIYQYERIENDIKDVAAAPHLTIAKGTVEFKEVTFLYNNRPMFIDFNLSIRKNEKVALVGHSGSGKTTLIKLLYRLYDPHAGQVLIDGHDIKEFSQESVRSELSIVPQECVLFDDTVYNNVAFSYPKATREQVFQAMHFAQLDKVIMNFPQKENTIVGERGVKLSGGEKQRVSIARAILANRRILVLDEATSALDSQTEHDIQEALQRLMQGRTSIIIAHRLSTIMHADKIVVLDRGRIVQIGTHKDLIRKKGQYKKLWNLQKGGYIR